MIDQFWLKKLSTYEKIYVGFSGGLDSTALLYSLAQVKHLQPKINAVHINHGISCNAAKWEIFCKNFCESLSIPFVVKYIHLEHKSNLEEAARNLRLEIFREILQENEAFLLAQHADDQAETLLLHLFRGTGIAGLAAMPAEKKFGKGELLRPLLNYSRASLQEYASQHQLSWVEDESNQNNYFARNYIRHSILPLVKARWPKVLENINNCISNCQEAQENLYDLAILDSDYNGAKLIENAARTKLSENARLPAPIFIGVNSCPRDPGMSTIKNLNLLPLYKLTKPRLKNVLRFWLKQNFGLFPNTKILNLIISEVIYAAPDACPQFKWDNKIIRRYQNTLHIVEATVAFLQEKPWHNFPASLQFNGYELFANPNTFGVKIKPSDQLQLRVRQGGEKFYWHGKTKDLKKLLQEWTIPYWQRSEVPLLYINNELAMVVGYAISDNFFSKDGKDAYSIQFNEVI